MLHIILYYHTMYYLLFDGLSEYIVHDQQSNVREMIENR